MNEVKEGMGRKTSSLYIAHKHSLALLHDLNMYKICCS